MLVTSVEGIALLAKTLDSIIEKRLNNAISVPMEPSAKVKGVLLFLQVLPIGNRPYRKHRLAIRPSFLMKETIGNRWPLVKVVRHILPNLRKDLFTPENLASKLASGRKRVLIHQN